MICRKNVKCSGEITRIELNNCEPNAMQIVVSWLYRGAKMQKKCENLALHNIFRGKNAHFRQDIFEMQS